MRMQNNLEIDQLNNNYSIFVFLTQSIFMRIIKIQEQGILIMSKNILKYQWPIVYIMIFNIYRYQTKTEQKTIKFQNNINVTSSYYYPNIACANCEKPDNLQIEMGCKTSRNGVCQELCSLGQFNCENQQIQCEYGYFLYLGNACVQCPYQQVIDSFTLYCMDCVEHPYTWSSNRTCSYEYTIESGDFMKGTYVRKSKQYTELYYIGPSTSSGVNLDSITRDVQYQYETYICSGCKRFCIPGVSENCNSITSPYAEDGGIMGIECLLTYEFKNQLCISCPPDCLKCSNGQCTQCNDGYMIQNGQCQKCGNGCLNCFNVQLQTVCTKCKEGKVAALDQRNCEECGNECQRCEYVTYASNAQYRYPTRTMIRIQDRMKQNEYIKRCRQCSTKSFVSHNGIDCVTCQIPKCDLCYYNIRGGVTTMDYDFEPSKGNDLVSNLLCFKCISGYTVSADKQSCVVSVLAPDQCDRKYADTTLKCRQCVNNVILNQQSNTCSSSCTSYISQCSSCFSYKSLDQTQYTDGTGQIFIRTAQTLYQCIQCSNGYYPNIFTGFCDLCPNNCQKCWQYSQTYNFTDYLYKMQPISNSLKETFLNDIPIKVQCTSCNFGYQLYGNECLGCSSNCQVENQIVSDDSINSCIFKSTYAFCGECYDTFNDRSLVSDKSECIECPLNCLACRERETYEITNLYFNPDNSNLIQYGRLCYKAQTMTMSNLQSVSYNSYLSLPILCIYQQADSTNTKRCRHTAQITVHVYCNEDEYNSIYDTLTSTQKQYHYNLNDYYSLDFEDIASIEFQYLETFQSYQSMNQATLEELTLDILFTNSIDYKCTFQKSTQLITEFHKNVYALSKFQVNIQSAHNEPITFYITDNFYLQDFPFVMIKNINVYSNLQNDFGLIITNNISSTYLQIQYCKLGYEQNKYKDSQIFTLKLENLKQLELKDVYFQNLQRSDQINFNQLKINNYVFEFTNVYLKSNQFMNNAIFPLTPYSIVNINNLVIQDCIFTNSSLFNNQQEYQLFVSKFSINRLIIKQTQFYQSSSIIKSSYISTLSINQLDIIGNRFNDTELFKCNTYQIQNVYIYMNVFTNYSLIFTTADQVPDTQSFYNQIKNQGFQISNLKFVENTCYNINCLMLLQTPYNSEEINSDLAMQNFYIFNNYIELSLIQRQSVSSAIIRVTEIKQVKLTNIVIDTQLSITVISLQDIASLEVSKFLCDFSNNIIGKKDTSPRTKIENSTIIQYPFNNKLPGNTTCSYQKQSFGSYSSYCLDVEDFIYGVKISDASLKGLLGIDNGFIYIQSYESLMKQTSNFISQSGTKNILDFYYGYTNEVIILENINIFNTSIAISNPVTNIGSIIIESDQIQTILIDNVQLIGNHLHQLVESITLKISTCFTILSPNSMISIKQLVAQNNRATQSQYGINIIKSQSLRIFSSLFNHTNIMESNWLDRFDEYQVNNYSQFLGQFNIESEGSNIYIQCKNLELDQTQFMNGKSLMGTAFYFLGQDIVSIDINNTEFTNLSTSLEYVDQAYGGSLYLNLQKSSYEIKLNKVTMNHSVSRIAGGCIYVQTSIYEQIISIQNSQFIECQSLQSSLIDIQFSVSSLILPALSIRNTNIMNNNFEGFLRQLSDISVEEEQQIISGISLIKQNYGILEIQQSQFIEIQIQGLMELKNMFMVILQDLVVKDITVFSKSLIEITHYTKQSTVELQNVVIDNITEQKVLTEEQFIYKFSSRCQSISSMFELANTQTCAEQEDLRQFYKDIYDYRQISQTKLDNSTLYNYYDSLSYSDKYVLNEIKLDTFREIKSFYSSNNVYIKDTVITQQDFSLCYFTNLQFAYEIESIPHYIKLSHIKSTNTIMMNSVTIKNSFCDRCKEGLILINNYDQSAHTTTSIFELTCQNNIIGYFGCLVITTQTIPQLNITYSNRILQSAIPTQKYHIYLQQSLFQSNSAQIGAGVSIIGVSVKITDSQFMDNKATLIGGGMTFVYDSESKNILDQFNNNYINNDAQLGSAIYMMNNNLNNLENSQIFIHHNSNTQIEQMPERLGLMMLEGQMMDISTFQENDGDLNDDNIIDNSNLQIIDIVSVQSSSIPNFKSNYLLLPSGQQISQYKYYYEVTQEQIPYNWVFRIYNLDKNKNIIKSVSSTETCTVSGRLMDELNLDFTKQFLLNFTSYSATFFDESNNSFNFDNLQIYFDPFLQDNLFLQLKFQCSSIKIPIYNQQPPYNVLSYNKNYALYLNLKTIPCQIGEAYLEQKCTACSSANTYSVQENSVQCKGINSIQMDMVTPVRIKLKEQYWRPFPKNDNIEECYNLKSNCLGGWVPGDTSCYDGHIGALCEQCDIYGIRGPQYSVSKKYTCGACQDTIQSNILIIIAISIFTLVTMIMSVKGNYEFIENLIHQQVLQSIGARINIQQNNASIIMKQLTNYLQIIASLTTFRISIPAAFVSSMEVLGNPTQSMAYSLDCFLVTFATMDLLYFRMAWALLMPLFYMIVFFFGYFSVVLMRIAPFKIGIIYTTFIYMFIYLQPTLVGGFISLLSSRTVSGIEWVQSNVSYQYYTEMHQYYIYIFIGPNLLVWSLLLPFIFMHFIRRNKHQLENMEVRKRWGFFYHEYTNQAYLWEFVKIFEKELVIISLTFYENKIVIKGLMIFLIVFLYGAFSFTFIPYKQKKLNFIDQMSTAACSCSLCLGVLIYASMNENLDYLQYIMFLIIIIINACLIALILFHLLEGYINKFDDKLDIVRNKIKLKFPNIDFQYPCLKKLLINKKDMKEKVINYWAILRYETREGIKRRRNDKNALLIIQRTKKSGQLSQDLSEKDIDIKQGNSLDQQVELKSPDIDNNEDIKLLKRPSSNYQGLMIQQQHSLDSSQVHLGKIFPETYSDIPTTRKLENRQEKILLKKPI
ncbi:unnamed protein product [Paramecium octaurelia]|uniref:Transmembrane protein n=1 Tax=Paramecium octaurelia TaxID=43137 RepID=A0A8S1SWG5_PAROT|nr:unnamed protein product [Paramecium octaurelia]